MTSYHYWSDVIIVVRFLYIKYDVYVRNVVDAYWDSFPLLLAHFCMEIQTNIMQARKKNSARDKGVPRQTHGYF